MICKYCGTELSERAKFCSECGARVIRTETPAEVEMPKTPHLENFDGTEKPEKPFDFSTGWEKEHKKPASRATETITFDWSSVVDESRKKTVVNIKSPWDNREINEKPVVKPVSPFTADPDEDVEVRHEKTLEEEIFEDAKNSEAPKKSRTMTFIDILKAEREERDQQSDTDVDSAEGNDLFKDLFGEIEAPMSTSNDFDFGFSETILPQDEREHTQGYTDLKEDIIAELEKAAAAETPAVEIPVAPVETGVEEPVPAGEEKVAHSLNFEEQLAYIKARREAQNAELTAEPPQTFVEEPAVEEPEAPADDEIVLEEPELEVFEVDTHDDFLFDEPAEAEVEEIEEPVAVEEPEVAAGEFEEPVLEEPEVEVPEEAVDESELVIEEPEVEEPVYEEPEFEAPEAEAEPAEEFEEEEPAAEAEPIFVPEPEVEGPEIEIEIEEPAAEEAAEAAAPADDITVDDIIDEILGIGKEEAVEAEAAPVEEVAVEVEPEPVEEIAVEEPVVEEAPVVEAAVEEPEVVAEEPAVEIEEPVVEATPVVEEKTPYMDRDTRSLDEELAELLGIDSVFYEPIEAPKPEAKVVEPVVEEAPEEVMVPEPEVPEEFEEIAIEEPEVPAEEPEVPVEAEKAEELTTDDIIDQILSEKKAEEPEVEFEEPEVAAEVEEISVSEPEAEEAPFEETVIEEPEVPAEAEPAEEMTIDDIIDQLLNEKKAEEIEEEPFVEPAAEEPVVFEEPAIEEPEITAEESEVEFAEPVAEAEEPAEEPAAAEETEEQPEELSVEEEPAAEEEAAVEDSYVEPEEIEIEDFYLNYEPTKRTSRFETITDDMIEADLAGELDDEDDFEVDDFEEKLADDFDETEETDETELFEEDIFAGLPPLTKPELVFGVPEEDVPDVEAVIDEAAEEFADEPVVVMAEVADDAELDAAEKIEAEEVSAESEFEVEIEPAEEEIPDIVPEPAVEIEPEIEAEAVAEVVEPEVERFAEEAEEVAEAAEEPVDEIDSEIAALQAKIAELMSRKAEKAATETEPEVEPAAEAVPEIAEIEEPETTVTLEDLINDETINDEPLSLYLEEKAEKSEEPVVEPVEEVVAEPAVEVPEAEAVETAKELEDVSIDDIIDSILGEKQQEEEEADIDKTVILDVPAIDVPETPAEVSEIGIEEPVLKENAGIDIMAPDTEPTEGALNIEDEMKALGFDLGDIDNTASEAEAEPAEELLFEGDEEGSEAPQEDVPMTIDELEKDLFGEIVEPAGDEATKKIEKYFTLYKKNEEFQKLLDQEYEKIKGGSDYTMMLDVINEYDKQEEKKYSTQVMGPITAGQIRANIEYERKTQMMEKLKDEQIAADKAAREAAADAAQVKPAETPAVAAVQPAKVEEKAVKAAEAPAQTAAAAVEEPKVIAPVVESEPIKVIEVDEEKGGGFLTVVAIIVAVLLAILLLAIVILNVAPDSAIAQYISNLIGNFSNLGAADDITELLL